MPGNAGQCRPKAYRGRSAASLFSSERREVKWNAGNETELFWLSRFGDSHRSFDATQPRLSPRTAQRSNPAF